MVRIGLVLVALAGIAVGIWLIADFGFGAVATALRTAGWIGLAAVTAAHAAAIALCAIAWRALLVKMPRRGLFLEFIWARALRDSIANLIGIIPCAGEIAGARELTWAGIPAGLAAATTIIDMTTELLSQLVFMLLGLAVLFAERPETLGMGWLAAGFVSATAAIVGFVVAQKNGLFGFLETLPRRLGLLDAWNDQSGSATVNAAIRDVYAHRTQFGKSILIHFAAWIARTAEAVVALQLMHASLPLRDVFALEAMVYAIRTAAFAVPSAVGVQEGGYVLIGAFFGVSPEMALALSLLKRAREVIIGIPTLIGWQVIESRRLLKRASEYPISGPL